jgi:class 3 adenylate cyclase
MRMPLYLDRHDIRDVTAEDVAEAHKADLRVQGRHSCRALTYWFDEQRGTAFCLIEAPTETAVRAMHREAHGLLPNLIIEVDPQTVTGFLGRVTDPEGAADNAIREAGFRAIMFTDMANSTEITNSIGDAGALVILAKHNALIRQALLAHEGREVDRAGDGFLISFASVSQAVACAVRIQQAFHSYNTIGTAPMNIAARIGIGAGEPLTDGSALFGATVNLAARICASAQPGQILVARVVRDLCAGKDFNFRRHGAFSMKGFPDPVELHWVEWMAQPAGQDNP